MKRKKRGKVTIKCNEYTGLKIRAVQKIEQ